MNEIEVQRQLSTSPVPKGVEASRRATSKLSADAHAWFFNAKVLFENQEYELAQGLLREILTLAPEHVPSVLMMGQIFRKTGRLSESRVCFQQLSRLEPSSLSFALLAETYYLLDDDEAAYGNYLSALRLIQDESPALFEIYKNLGNIYCRAGDFEAAEEYYNKAYTLAADSDTLMVNYGTLEIQREDLNKARARFKQALEINFKNDKAWVGLALTHNQMTDHELAWANLTNALEANPRNRTALQLAVQWGFRDRRLEPVIERLQVYLSHPEHDEEMSFLLAQVYCAAGRFDLAVLEAERNLLWNPLHEGTLQLQHQLRDYFKNLEKARE
jgi:tetratricopeptide (TPR) repeat protein